MRGGCPSSGALRGGPASVRGAAPAAGRRRPRRRSRRSCSGSPASPTGCSSPGCAPTSTGRFAQAGTVNTANAFGYLAGAMITPQVSARLGRRATFLGGIVIVGRRPARHRGWSPTSRRWSLRVIAGIAGRARLHHRDRPLRLARTGALEHPGGGAHRRLRRRRRGRDRPLRGHGPADPRARPRRRGLAARLARARRGLGRVDARGAVGHGVRPRPRAGPPRPGRGLARAPLRPLHRRLPALRRGLHLVHHLRRRPPRPRGDGRARRRVVLGAPRPRLAGERPALGQGDRPPARRPRAVGSSSRSSASERSSRCSAAGP